ncbi:hypothetical protein HPB49_008710 [Dermacentor silvarum]|uniref:Uncharacterized protein n=1 Tax=Dermacentor silvarum TaxID=543639 RepID=A0ACB8DNT1_DERSI|nr:hypothetical protein HPB49_008710 [Dermacentor silvarum]
MFVIPLEALDAAPMSARHQRKWYAGVVEQPIRLNNTASIQNTSYAATPASPQLKNARNTSRRRTWCDADENSLATMSGRKGASHHHSSRTSNAFQLSPVKGTHAFKNWTHRPHPAPEAVPEPEGDPDPEGGERPEGGESASIPEAVLGPTAAPGPVPDP